MGKWVSGLFFKTRPPYIDVKSMAGKFGSLWFLLPYFWLLMFFLLPFLIILKISFAQSQFSIPPYTDLTSWENYNLRIDLSFQNFAQIFKENLYIQSSINSLKVSVVATFFCLIIGYPIAWALLHTDPKRRNLWVLFMILPSWTSLLIRVYSWMGLLKSRGLFSKLLMNLHIIDKPLHLLNTEAAVYIGLVYIYLPFMVLPIYSTLSKIDKDLVEAALDLGAKPFKVFLNIIVPLSINGVIAGSLLVFIPSVGEFVIPELLGGSNVPMIGNLVWQEFFTNQNWPVASAITVMMILLLILPISWLKKYQDR